MLRVRWLTAFLDMPAETFDTGVSFWQSATGYGLSPFRGMREEFATLVPQDADPFLRVQRIVDGQAGCHLDVHVDDPGDAVAGATAAGATVVARPPGYIVLRSPAGMVFCLVDHEDAESQRPPPARWGGGQRSLVDQLCLDIPAARYDEECAFWARLTGWQLRDGARPEFRYLDRPPSMPLRILLQRRDDNQGSAGAHLDLACDDVPAERARHEALGATVVRITPDWVTLRAPTGQDYCVTRRDPAPGRLL